VTDNVRDSGQLSNSTSGNRDRRNGTGNKKETTSEIEQYNKLEELLPGTLKLKTKEVKATVYCTHTTYKHTRPHTTNSCVVKYITEILLYKIFGFGVHWHIDIYVTGHSHLSLCA
jgi:hypothetical protein